MEIDQTPTWEMVKYLGTGGCGVVHLEKSENYRGGLRYRAVKVCLIPRRFNFERELDILKTLSSSRFSALFVKYYDHWMEGDQCLKISMEYVSKGDLSNYIGQGHGNRDAREIMEDLVTGVKFLHEQGITHRDIKPKNILVVQNRPAAPRWWVKIADFGISKAVLEDSDTSMYTVVGTANYRAPEIGLNQGNLSTTSYTNKVDMWSLGCVLFNIASDGHTAFTEHQLRGYQTGELGFNHQHAKLWLKGSGQSILEALLQIDPVKRPSAAEVLESSWFGKRLLAVAFSPNGELYVSASLDGTIIVRDTVTEGTLHVINRHADAVYTIAFSPDGHLLASGSDDRTIVIFDTALWKPRRILQGHADCVRRVTFSPNGRLLASGSDDGSVKIWEVESHQLLHSIDAHHENIAALAFSTNSRLLASACTGGQIKLWNPLTRQLEYALGDHGRYYLKLLFLSDTKLASATDDGEIELWDLGNKSDPRVLIYRSKMLAVSAAISPDGQVALGMENGTIALFTSLEKDASHRLIRAHAYETYSLAFSHDGRLLASVSDDQKVGLWGTARP